ncbi:adenylate kinase [Shimia sp. R10_1]|uniref:adenylate kinase n=1 Tax=Shimia sp. R10_1 TaxID=2821095 RepID=UPI0032AFC1FC
MPIGCTCQLFRGHSDINTSYKHLKVYIFGASGSGSSTLAQHVAEATGLVHVDADDHFWAPVDPPFSVKNPPQERVRLMKEAMGCAGWVLSGSCNGWGEALIAQADLLVFTTLATEVRIQRLVAREAGRFGARIKEGGDMYQIHRDFIEWAKGYDDPAFHGRNIEMHERWIASQNKPTCRIDSNGPVDASVQAVCRALAAL